MSIWSRIKRSFTTKTTEKRDSNFTKWFEPHNMFQRRTDNSLATNEAVFSAITRLSNSLGSLPIKLYKDYMESNTPLADLISNAPNPNMTSFELIRNTEVHRNVYGNAYWLKKYDSNYQVISLLLLDPLRINPVVESETGELFYQLETDDGTYYIHNMDVLHFKHIHTSGYKGISPLDVLRGSIEYDRKVKEFSLSQMEIGIRASFILQLQASLGEEKKKAMLESFRSFYSQNGGVILLDSGMELTEIKRNFIDMKVFEVEKITKARVAMVFNLPLHMLGETEGQNFSSMEQMSLEFLQNTLLAIVRMYEQEMNRKLISNQERLRGLTFKFSVNALLRADIQTRGDFYFKAVRSGLFTPNEVRALEELPPLPGGEKLYMSRDLSPIDDPERLALDKEVIVNVTEDARSSK